MTSQKLLEEMIDCVPDSESEFKQKLSNWFELVAHVELDDYAREMIYETFLKCFMNDKIEFWQAELIRLFLSDWNKAITLNNFILIDRWRKLNDIMGSGGNMNDNAKCMNSENHDL